MVDEDEWDEVRSQERKEGRSDREKKQVAWPGLAGFGLKLRNLRLRFIRSREGERRAENVTTAGKGAGGQTGN